jgi:hypothetical protein
MAENSVIEELLENKFSERAVYDKLRIVNTPPSVGRVAQSI